MKRFGRALRRITMAKKHMMSVRIMISMFYNNRAILQQY
jgi:hypothetical protein